MSRDFSSVSERRSDWREEGRDRWSIEVSCVSDKLSAVSMVRSEKTSLEMSEMGLPERLISWREEGKDRWSIEVSCASDKANLLSLVRWEKASLEMVVIGLLARINSSRLLE